MSAIVEKGAARCPRCMALAEYRFRESDAGLLRYEVSCDSCGHDHVEVCTPASAAA